MFLKERTKVAILAPPIRLNMNYLRLKKALNMGLKLKKNIKHIRFLFKKIKPREPTISINKANIIVMTTDRGLGMAPYIRENKF
jgi:hypothetical protein